MLYVSYDNFYVYQLQLKDKSHATCQIRTRFYLYLWGSRNTALLGKRQFPENRWSNEAQILQDSKFAFWSVGPAEPNIVCCFKELKEWKLIFHGRYHWSKYKIHFPRTDDAIKLIFYHSKCRFLRLVQIAAIRLHLHRQNHELINKTNTEISTSSTSINLQGFCKTFCH